MKKIILALLLLLIAGCSSETVVLEEVSDNLITGNVVAEPVDIAPYYDFSEGETKTILGHSITVYDLAQKPEAVIIIDGVAGKVVETKNEEIINKMKVSINKIDFSDINELKVNLKIEELNLENNQYIIAKNQKNRIEDKDVTLIESRSNGYIQVIVYDKDDMKSEEGYIASGETIEFNSLRITNLENYYRVSQYALIEVQESWTS